MPPPTCRPPGHAFNASFAATSFPPPSIITWAPSSSLSLYSRAKCSAECWDTWFVWRAVDELSRVPPTICFTWPAWRSMQGRKRVIFCCEKKSRSWERYSEVKKTWSFASLWIFPLSDCGAASAVDEATPPTLLFYIRLLRVNAGMHFDTRRSWSRIEHADQDYFSRARIIVVEFIKWVAMEGWRWCLKC